MEAICMRKRITYAFDLLRESNFPFSHWTRKIWENIHVLPCRELAWLEGLFAGTPLSNSLSEALEKQKMPAKDNINSHKKEDNIHENSAELYLLNRKNSI